MCVQLKYTVRKKKRIELAFVDFNCCLLAFLLLVFLNWYLRSMLGVNTAGDNKFVTQLYSIINTFESLLNLRGRRAAGEKRKNVAATL